MNLIFRRYQVMSHPINLETRLETCYQGVTKVNNVKLYNLTREFENLKMKDSETIDNFITQVMSVVNQLRQYGEDFRY